MDLSSQQQKRRKEYRCCIIGSRCSQSPSQCSQSAIKYGPYLLTMFDKKKGQARNQWQNCRIGQPSAKKWVFLPDQFGLGPEVKGKLGEIRSLLETLGGSLYPRKKNYSDKTWYGQQLSLVKNFCATHPTRGSLSKNGTDQYCSP